MLSTRRVQNNFDKRENRYDTSIGTRLPVRRPCLQAACGGARSAFYAFRDQGKVGAPINQVSVQQWLDGPAGFAESVVDLVGHQRTLPPGLTLNTSTGAIPGAPTTAGTYWASIHSVLQVGLSYTLPNTGYTVAP